MALRAVEHQFTGNTIKYNETYDPTKTVLGQLIYQYTGNDPLDKYAGPVRMGRDSTGQIYGVARPAETSTAVPGIYPHVVRWCNKEGYYSTGTVEVSGTAVTGSGTGWLADGVPVLARIGFGSTEYIVIREKQGLSDKKFLYYLAISPSFREIAIKAMIYDVGT